ncbi:MAG: endonuclease domain-containing protein [Synergistaceae bacterium]|nr:endonuclease domain-containing protein [Synergistaceae bacterium]
MKKEQQHLCLQALVDNLGDTARTETAIEYRFHPVRRWRFDAAFPEKKIAVEIDGGAFIGGRHTRGAGFKADCEKLNNAALLGWRVFRFLPRQLKTGEAHDVLSLALGVKKADTS